MISCVDFNSTVRSYPQSSLLLSSPHQIFTKSATTQRVGHLIPTLSLSQRCSSIPPPSVPIPYVMMINYASSTSPRKYPRSIPSYHANQCPPFPQRRTSKIGIKSKNEKKKCKEWYKWKVESAALITRDCGVRVATKTEWDKKGEGGTKI